ncbi:hypothetical protein [Bradyrhizobium sp. Ai1a-2]|uniref:hypothetical protein n=1 Tax=Bradyrhizobium sp. Ai1a-2 TaxID=196490 RepID=UPI001AEC2234|nr:hypothetical protein [Bradyrhizobium sp. Ai1a-2]
MTPVVIVAARECRSFARERPNWSAPEQWAWAKICDHLNIDFDELEANRTVDRLTNAAADKLTAQRQDLYERTVDEIRTRNQHDPERLAGDFSRRLRYEFFAEIFGAAELRNFTWNAPLVFSGFNTDRLIIDTAALKSLDIRNAHIGHFSIQNSTIDGGLRLENVRLASAKVHLVTAKHLLLNNVSVAASNFGPVRRDDGRPPFRPAERNGELKINTASIADRLSIIQGDFDSIDLNFVKVDDLFIDSPAWNLCGQSDKPELSIRESLHKGRFTLMLDPGGRCLPRRIKVDQSIFANTYLGPDPLPVIRAMEMGEMMSRSGPELAYALIAKSYADRGQTAISDRVLIAKNNQDWHLAKPLTLDFIGLTFTWLVADYGFHPEWGLVWIAGFVVLGWIIFRRASGRLAAGSYRPRSTLLLALDSVIPGIQLDKNHQEVRYDGWPQIMLYLLRVLGAVLVFVALSYLQKRLFG